MIGNEAVYSNRIVLFRKILLLRRKLHAYWLVGFVSATLVWIDNKPFVSNEQRKYKMNQNEPKMNDKWSKIFYAKATSVHLCWTICWLFIRLIIRCKPVRQYLIVSKVHYILVYERFNRLLLESADPINFQFPIPKRIIAHLLTIWNSTRVFFFMRKSIICWRLLWSCLVDFCFCQCISYLILKVKAISILSRRGQLVNKNGPIYIQCEYELNATSCEWWNWLNS